VSLTYKIKISNIRHPYRFIQAHMPNEFRKHAYFGRIIVGRYKNLLSQSQNQWRPIKSNFSDQKCIGL